MRHSTLSKYLSRLMAVLLCLSILTALPTARATETTEPPVPETTQIPAATEAPETPEVPVAETVPVEPTYSGTCGDSLSWNFSGGTLTITGSGRMTDFPETAMAPWYPVRKEILRLELPDGLTSVGNLAFYECGNLKTVVIPNTVTRIGKYAFASCSGLELLTLGTGVQEIGDCAFSDCVRIAGLRLPDGLQRIGLKSFYRCEAITAVVVPRSVQSLGISAFAYCANLVSADIQANIREIPEFLFYGCNMLSRVTLSESTTSIPDYAFRKCVNLSFVYYGGSNMTSDEIRERIDSIIPEFVDNGRVEENVPDDNTASANNNTENPDGTNTWVNTTVVPGEGSTVSTTITDVHPEDTLAGEISSDITVIVDGETGWDEAGDAVQDALDNIRDIIDSTGSTSTPTEITIYIQTPGEIDQGFIDSLADQDLNITIVDQDGSTWKLNTEDMEHGSGAYDLRYTVSAGDEALSLELEASSSFRLKFLTTAQINAQVMVRIGTEYTLQNATLFQRQDNELTRRQSTVVDKDGYVHLYLGSVDADSEYYLGLNLADAQQDAVVPQELSAEYAAPMNVQPLQYEITGRTSSWNMTFSQVTWIMVAFLGTTVIVVGIVMYSLNKRRLRMGYVPDLEDEDYE